ncbi:hypothetical protein [Caldimonas thermodepolymerans]|uniref:Uncharacterized protein n=1 Tax=Caldimonas thermodepolymerans TaxID=215580 RepID=A0AA46DDC6_9BURK|nr:hypothetical protein [Caldimonas thermodepolymerans]TCP06548.1 hypothetical protein EV676_10631 [Caldimonas thermodepolymerans]UZG49395.1 hypothetical protein ONS87_07175 [Caldimonas thermodepolymerans]
MTICIELKNKAGDIFTFVARESSGYVFVNPTPTSWGRQLFDRHGNAFIADDEDELRRIAKRWMKAQAAAE